ncbi:DNA (cytosine-5-)-methyltransferase [Ureaplasma canigenitalium]|uniref:DNA (cytosine-5-)-methyltransferase n=1 Tax=Ureaplasma canigenitalium TaxID=42092 RepID=UPI0004E1037B|nr:DNA (cytosine-5-)-methyltransferase [Ureaplasma canigenitalium]
MKLTVIELFAGVGGFRVGLNKINNIDSKGRAIEKGSWEFLYANQYEPLTVAQHAYDCYKKRFVDSFCSNIDIKDVNAADIPNHSLLVAGFPCQDYSVAKSLTNEKGIEGKKGVLFWEIKRIIEAKQTPFLLLENVDRLLKSPSGMKGRDFAIMLKTFHNLGYGVQWRVINASYYGMPQKRKRIFIFAFKENTLFFKDSDLSKQPLPSNLFNTVFPIEIKSEIKELDLNHYKDAMDITKNYHDGKFLDSGIMLNGVVKMFDVNPIRENIFPLKKIINKAFNKKNNYEKYIVDLNNLDKWIYLKGAKKIERFSKSGHKYFYSEGSMNFPDDLDSPARTLLTSEGSVNRSSHIIFDMNLKQYRLLTPNECELIQMFPLDWTDTMNDRKRYFMMGNALVTGIIERLEPYLKEIIKNEPEVHQS